MRRRQPATIEDLRRAIDRLPRRTRVAMLEGIGGNDIIVGAYANHDGVCPMLAAHRAGGRTNVIAFAKAWDRFAFRDARTARARRATRRELLVLSSHLEASLLEESAPAAELAAVCREHLDLVAAREHEYEYERPGDADRSVELADSPGWAWTRVVRRQDDYERLLRRLELELPEADVADSEPLLTR